VLLFALIINGVLIVLIGVETIDNNNPDSIPDAIDCDMLGRFVSSNLFLIYCCVGNTEHCFTIVDTILKDNPWYNAFIEKFLFSNNNLDLRLSIGWNMTDDKAPLTIQAIYTFIVDNRQFDDSQI
jgi:hypothetical protein